MKGARTFAYQRRLDVYKRQLFGLPVLIAVTLWYRLITAKEEVLNQELEKELIAHQVVEAQVEVPAGLIDRITVKDGSRIHLIKADELIYIQACGDYVDVYKRQVIVCADTLSEKTANIIGSKTRMFFILLDIIFLLIYRLLIL